MRRIWLSPRPHAPAVRSPSSLLQRSPCVGIVRSNLKSVCVSHQGRFHRDSTSRTASQWTFSSEDNLEIRALAWDAPRSASHVKSVVEIAYRFYTEAHWERALNAVRAI